LQIADDLVMEPKTDSNHSVGKHKDSAHEKHVSILSSQDKISHKTGDISKTKTIFRNNLENPKIKHDIVPMSHITSKGHNSKRTLDSIDQIFTSSDGGNE